MPVRYLPHPLAWFRQVVGPAAFYAAIAARQGGAPAPLPEPFRSGARPEGPCGGPVYLRVGTPPTPVLRHLFALPDPRLPLTYVGPRTEFAVAVRAASRGLSRAKVLSAVLLCAARLAARSRRVHVEHLIQPPAGYPDGAFAFAYSPASAARHFGLRRASPRIRRLISNGLFYAIERAGGAIDEILAARFP
jgi:hypothetical protein